MPPPPESGLESAARSANSQGARAEGRLTEWLLRSFALLALVLIVARWGHAFIADPTRWTVALLLITEGYTLLLVLFARPASQRDMSLSVIAATVYATVFAALLDPVGTVHLLPEGFGAALQVVSMTWQFTAKVFLGRSFGLLPAQRGVVTAGPYRLVRHPIYFGYLIGHIGFLLANFSWRNFAVLVVLYIAQVHRIRREEAVLARSSAEYRQYQQRVRWRLLPWVY